MRTHKGWYQPINRKKCAKDKYQYKSSWELVMMRKCDEHPNIVEWAYESVKIPYQNPLTGKYTVYVPDFLITTLDRHGRKKTQLIEIKPGKETFINEAKDKRSKARLAVNVAKWKAAQQWASNRGIDFKVITEHDLFNKPKK